jgi:hypothetical protein
LAIPELGELVRAILRQRAEVNLWLAMLREDPVYRKIPEDLRRPAIERAAAYGRQAALDSASRYGTTDPMAISQRLGVQVIFSDEAYLFGKIVQTSTYVHRTRTIKIYTGAVAEMNAFLAQHGLEEPLRIENVTPVYLAHDSLGRAADLLRVVTFKWGPLVLRSGISQMSEIAADAYAQALLQLPFAPRLLDYLTICIHNEENGRRQLAALANV